MNILETTAMIEPGFLSASFRWSWILCHAILFNAIILQFFVFFALNQITYFFPTLNCPAWINIEHNIFWEPLCYVMCIIFHFLALNKNPSVLLIFIILIKATLGNFKLYFNELITELTNVITVVRTEQRYSFYNTYSVSLQIFFF